MVPGRTPEVQEGPLPGLLSGFSVSGSMGFMLTATTYLRPDVVYRTGSIRPEIFSGDPVKEAYRVAEAFTQDPGIIGPQYYRAANASATGTAQADVPASVAEVVDAGKAFLLGLGKKFGK